MKATDKFQFKRHQKDVHECKTASTSPPPKRKRRLFEDKHSTTEVKEVEEEDEVENLSFKLEDMDIDIEEQIMMEHSERMDKKVLEKQRKLDETETKETKKKTSWDELSSPRLRQLA